MERSQNGFVERMDKHSTKRAAAVQAVIRGLVAHSTAEPFPAMSNHFKTPEEIGAVALSQEHGFTADGDYI